MFQRLEHLHRDIFLVATVLLPRGILIRYDQVQGCDPQGLFLLRFTDGEGSS